LVENGEILSSFQHERVHEPLGGGRSIYCRSVPVNDAMLEHSRRMLKYLRWTGVAMVEYKWEASTGAFALMEINGRFWGSVGLAVAAGIDFPLDLFRLLAHKERPAARPYPPAVYSRRVPDDILWFWANWHANRADPCLAPVPRLRTVVEWLRP